MKVVIMAGGKGNRFWPRSLEEKPKQFLAITSEETMLQLTYSRLLKRWSEDDIYVATVMKYTGLVMEQLPSLSPHRLIVEPEQRDTGPCMALTALFFLGRQEDEPFVTVPSDQYIEGDHAFYQAMELAVHIAEEQGAIATIGIKPTRPETGYGYIETEEMPDSAFYPVKRFIEKPDKERAEQLIRKPNVYWNSGIFAWKPSTLAYYYEKFEPELWHSLKGRPPEQVYGEIKRISVDYAILEKADRIVCIPTRFAWDDVGTWTALTRIYKADEMNNVVLGPVYVTGSTGCIICADGPRTVVIGADDLIVVTTPDAVLVCRRSEEQTIKKVLADMEQQFRGK
jgi:mannose-1-phosphate guanylyltransferase